MSVSESLNLILMWMALIKNAKLEAMKFDDTFKVKDCFNVNAKTWVVLGLWKVNFKLTFVE